MNVRISDKNLKFKITNDELDLLLNGKHIQAKTSVYIIRIQPADEVSLVVDNKNMVLNIPMKILQSLKDMGRNRDGITMPYNGDNLTLQVDFRKT